MKKKTIQRAFAWALTLVMVLSAAPLGVFAEGEEEQTCTCTVKCGEEGNTDCPVCSTDAEKCAVMTPKQEDEGKGDGGTDTLTKNDGGTPSGGEGGPSGNDTTDSDSDKSDSTKNGSDKSGSDKSGSNKSGSDKSGSDKSGSDKSGSDKSDSGKSGSDKSDSGKSDSNSTGTTGGNTSGGTEGLGTPGGSTGTTGDGNSTGGGTGSTGGSTGGQSTPGSNSTGGGTGGSTSNQPSGSGSGTPTGTGSGSSGSKQDDSLEFQEDGNDVIKIETIVGGGTKAYKITFDTQGKGNAPQEQYTGEGGKLSELPALNNVTGYTFGGWYRDKDCTKGNKVKNGDTFTKDTELYAKWTPIRYTVVFHDNYRNPEQTCTQRFDYGTIAHLTYDTTIISRQYYDCRGWAETRNGNLQYNLTSLVEDLYFGQKTTLDLYTIWDYEPRTVTFDACDGKIIKDGKEEKSFTAYTQESPLNTVKAEEVPTPTREGYAFLGWYDQKTNNKFSLDTPYNEDTILEARWVALETPNGVTPAGNFLEGKNLEDGTKKVAIRVVPVDGPDLEQIKNKLGVDGEKLAVYDLSVQMLNEDGTKRGEFESVNGLIQFNFTVTGNVEDVYHNGSRMSKDAKPGYRQTGSTLTIWANSFSPYAIVTEGYRITLDPRGGTLAADVPNTIVTKLDGTLKEPLPTPTKTGYTFGGWYWSTEYEDDEKVENNAKFETNTTLYAKWEPITYTVVFHDNYRKPEKEETSEQTLTYDKEERLSYDDTKIKREYYQLDGWAETSDGEIVYGTNQQVKNLCSQQGAEKHLYAVWSYQRKTVIFDADGGKIKENGKEEKQVTVFTQESPINTVKAKEVPVPMTREGYYFGGWYTQKDGKGDLVKPDKTEFIKERTTVYAYWIEFKPVTVTFKCQGGTARIGSADVKEFTMQTKWPGVLDGTPTTPSRSSYKFEGWYTAAGVKVDEDTLFLQDATVYARWKRAVSITGNPRTGDQVKLEAAIAILVAAAIGLGATVVLKNRKDK